MIQGLSDVVNCIEILCSSTTRSTSIKYLGLKAICNASPSNSISISSYAVPISACAFTLNFFCVMSSFTGVFLLSFETREALSNVCKKSFVLT